MVFTNIKDAFRYHKFLENNISTLSYYLRDDNNLTKITEEHQRSKSNIDVQNETINMTTERTYNCEIKDIVYLIKQLIEEKLKLSLAIEDAKKNIKLDWVENGSNLTLDSAIEFNKYYHNIIDNLKRLIDLKSSESKKHEQGINSM